jgi:hypothetical protein
VRFLSIALAAISLSAAPLQLRPAGEWKSPSPLRGGAPDPSNPGVFFTWGAAAHRWENGRPTLVATAPHGFHSGGCVLDFDRDGHADLVLATRPSEGELGDLLLFRGPRFTSTRLDTYVELHDCIPATLHGQSGFLTVHRHAQIRFYTPAGVREIYSIYTASRQSGLALADVDADRRPDILAGNYWIHSPATADLPWHIYAIHLHHESPEAATFSIAAWPHLLIAAQRERAATPVRIFSRPRNPRQLWPETTLPGIRLDQPRAATTHDGAAVFGHSRGILLVDPETRETAAIPWQPVRALWSNGATLYALSEGAVSAWRK